MDNNYQVDINANVTNGSSRMGGKFGETIARQLNKSSEKTKARRDAWAKKNPQQAKYMRDHGKPINTPGERAVKAGVGVAMGAAGAVASNAIKTSLNKKVNDKLDEEGVTNKHERDMINSTVNGAVSSATKTIPQGIKTMRGGSRLGAIGQGLIGRVYDKNSEIFVNGLSPEQLSILLKIIPETDMDALHEAIPGSEGHELAYIPVQTLNTMGL